MSLKRSSSQQHDENDGDQQHDNNISNDEKFDISRQQATKKLCTSLCRSPEHASQRITSSAHDEVKLHHLTVQSSTNAANDSPADDVVLRLASRLQKVSAFVCNSTLCIVLSVASR
jgi:hypothetical protein